jgi:hypothetical protein
VKRIIWSSVALVFGVLCIFGAIVQLNSDRVECGGETMRQGDVCVSKTRGGRVTESTLEESKTSGKVGAIAGIVIGSLIILIAAHNLKIGIRNRKTAAQAAVAGGPWPDAPLPPQQAHQQYAPQQQYSPQYAPPQYPPQQQQYSPSNSSIRSSSSTTSRRNTSITSSRARGMAVSAAGVCGPGGLGGRRVR